VNRLYEYLSRAAGAGGITPGEELEIKVDLAVAHDGSGPAVVDRALEMGLGGVFDPRKVLFFFDHCIPAPSVKARENHLKILQFCKQRGIKVYHHGEGVIHQVILEEHRLAPGSILVGADGHVATAGAYGVIAFSVTPVQFVEVMRSGVHRVRVPEVVEVEIGGEIRPPTTGRDVAIHLLGTFGQQELKGKAVVLRGSAIEKASFDDRLAIANLMAETGAVTCLVACEGPLGGAHHTYKFDAGEIPPSVLLPPAPVAGEHAGSPSRETGPVAVPLTDVAGTPVTQVIIGACSAGRLSDLKVVADILRGRRVADGVTCVVIPGSKKIANEADRLGISAAIRNSGAILVNPGCGTCYGAHQGVLASGDVAVSTTTKNAPGRMGDPGAAVYLASPVTAAWAAVRGALAVE
jgi:homoaconitase/3-isopropylmalate dehydratase large subunit